MTSRLLSLFRIFAPRQVSFLATSEGCDDGSDSLASTSDTILPPIFSLSSFLLLFFIRQRLPRP